MKINLRNKKQCMAVWAAVCAVFTMLWILRPVTELSSLGLEGANQANLRRKTEELTEGRMLEFYPEMPSGSARQIGFYFSTNGHEFSSGSLTLQLYSEETLLNERSVPLADMQEDQFVFVSFPADDTAKLPPGIWVKIYSDAVSEGPSVWLNETTVTPGSAALDGILLEDSLVYNLLYPAQVHRYKDPIFAGAILFLFGLGVCSAGGFSPAGKKKREKEKSSAVIVMPSGRQVLALCGIVGLTAMLFFYLYDTQIRIAQNTTEKAAVLAPDGETVPVTEQTALVSQIVRPKEDRLTGLGVRFWIEEDAQLTEGMMHASVTDLTLEQVMCETDIEASQFISGEYVGLLFHDSQTGVADHEYRIDLTFSPELWDSGLLLAASGNGICVNAYLYFNIFLKRFFFFMFLGVEAFLCLFWYLLAVKRARPENILLASLLFFGLIYNVMLTPQMVPDEAKHIDMAYRYSNDLLGYESLGDTKMLMRADDAALSFTASPSFSNYRNIYYGLFSKVKDASMIETDVSSNTEGSLLLYLPAVLGMSLARALGWGTVPMLLFARYLNLCVFALLARAGMKRLPFGKMTLFVTALLPINLQQCTSFSHDAVLHGLVFFYCCLCLETIYSQERMNGRRMVLLELTALFLVYCKSGSYLPLAFLPVLIPAAHYGGKREKYAATASLLGIPVLAFIMKQMQTVAGIVGTTAATSVVSTGDGSAYLSGYTVGYFLHDPLEFVYMMVNTAFDKIGFYLESLVGYKLGWVEIETSMLIVLLFWFLLFLSACDTRGNTVKIRRFERFWMIFLCLGCTGLILLGMLFGWTPMGHVSVEGVQGRYFLPFLLILLTACKSRLVLLDRNADRGIAAAAVLGQLLTLTYVIKQVLMV